MLAIDFRLDGSGEREYLDQVLTCISEKECRESDRKLRAFVDFLNPSVHLKKRLGNKAKVFEKNTKYKGFGYLCMWLVMPYEDMNAIREIIFHKVKSEIEPITRAAETLSPPIMLEKSQFYRTLKKQMIKKLTEKQIDYIFNNGSLWLKKYDEFYTYFALFKEVYEKKFTKKNINGWIVEKTGLRVCPYCNILYTYNRGDKATAQMDHFFPKAEYPIFSLSFYNLVPSCPVCNYIKHDKEEFVSPYKGGAFSTLHIGWTLSGSGKAKLEDMIQLEINTDVPEEKKNIEKLKLMEAYKHHRDYAAEIIRKAEIYTNEYTRKMIRAIFIIEEGRYVEGDGTDADPSAASWITEEEIDRFYFGNYLEERDYSKRSLAKMTGDIVKECM